jgi:hypothetical protein
VLDFLQNSDLVSIILSDEVIFCAIFTLSVFIAVHSLLGPHAAEQRSVHTPGKNRGGSQRSAGEHPWQTRAYPQPARDPGSPEGEVHPDPGILLALQYIDRRWHDEQIEKEREEGEDKDNQIQRQRMGLDRFI